jgi:hypothetical protein
MVPAALPRVAPRHWVYLDEQRTHEVHAEVEARPEDDLLVTTEFPAGSRDATEAVQSARRVTAETEVARHLLDLESRLRLSGKYYRLDVASMQWTPLGAPKPDVRVDLRAIELPMPGGAPGAKMGFHHFHNPGGEDRLLITMPRTDIGGDRHVLAELSFEFPQVDAGDLQVRHTRMTPPLLRSSLVQEHVEKPRQGFSKLIEAKDYHAAYGEGWVESARMMWRSAASRLLRRPATTPTPPAPQPKTPLAPERVADLREALVDARVLGLKARFLQSGDEARALLGGEHAIRRLVQTKRRQHDHTVAYDLSMLESALLLQYAIPAESWSLCEEESDKLLRFVQGYHRR